MVDMLHSHGTLSNSRLGDDDAQKYVDYLTMNDNMASDFNLGVQWESAVTITTDGSWHYESEDAELRSTKDLLHRLVNAAGNGGNLLLNVGPDKHGVIPKNMEKKLKEMGDWLAINGEAIYDTKPGPYPYQLSWGSMTQREEDGNTNLYLNVVDWPKSGEFTFFGLANEVLSASLLSTGETLEYSSKFDSFSGQNIITLLIPKDQPDDYVSVIKLQVAGEAVMDGAYLQQSDGTVMLDAYNATIHDLKYVPEKPSKAIDMKMFTVSNRRPMLADDYVGQWDYQRYKRADEGIMPGRGLTVSGFTTQGQALSWDLKMYQSGSYDVVAVYLVDKNAEWEMEGKLRVNIAGQSVENSLTESKRVKTITAQKMEYFNSVLGTVNISTPGAQTLTLEVVTDLKGKTPRLKGLMLVPIEK
jgi:alpha-L-fucosidase